VTIQTIELKSKKFTEEKLEKAIIELMGAGRLSPPFGHFDNT
jgi:hypothetical protein